MSRLFIATLCCAGLVLTWSCRPAERAETEEMAETGAVEEGAAMAEEMAVPDTTGAALWAHLEAADYQAAWALWPEKGRLYAGTQPHGALLTTYLNPAAQQALSDMAGSMPAGAIIVKENYMPDSALAAVTVMYKVEGYDPANNDWFWLKRLADGTIEVEGRGAGCIACHTAKAGNDYIFTGSLSGAM